MITLMELYDNLYNYVENQSLFFKYFNKKSIKKSLSNDIFIIDKNLIMPTENLIDFSKGPTKLTIKFIRKDIRYLKFKFSIESYKSYKYAKRIFRKLEKLRKRYI